MQNKNKQGKFISMYLYEMTHGEEPTFNVNPLENWS